MPRAITLQGYTLSQDAPAGYHPSEEERDAVKLAEKLFQESKKSKEGHEQRWIENYKMFRGRQWLERRPSYRHQEVLNYIASEIYSVVVLLTDNRPQITVTPEDPTDLEFAEIMNEVLTSKWDTEQWSRVVVEACVDAAIYGTAFSECCWDADLADGLGDINFETEDIFFCFPDPNARAKINDKYSDYFLTAIPTDVGKVKRKYPDKKDFIHADLEDIASNYIDREDQYEVRYKSPTDNRARLETDRSLGLGKPNQVLVITTYLKSFETEEVEIGSEIDPATGINTPQHQSRLKYPNGRKIVTACGVFLEGDENPYASGKFPYAVLHDHILPREMFGIGEVDQLRSPNQIVNKLISYVLDVLTIMGNPIWIVDTSSGIETDALVNSPGLIVEKAPGSEVRRESGVQLQPFVLETLRFMTENIINKLGSTTDVSRGFQPGGDSSGYAIAQLQEAAQTKIRGKSRNLEFFLKDIGDLMVEHVLQFYTVPRIVRLTSNQDSYKYFKFYVGDKADETGTLQKIATIQEFKQDPVTKQVIESVPREISIKSRLDVRINVGTTLPFAAVQRKVLAERLFDKGVIDAEELLTQLDYPNKEKILDRMNQRAQAAAMQGVPNGGSNATPGNPSPGPSAGPIGPSGPIA